MILGGIGIALPLRLIQKHFQHKEIINSMSELSDDIAAATAGTAELKDVIAREAIQGATLIEVNKGLTQSVDRLNETISNMQSNAATPADLENLRNVAAALQDLKTQAANVIPDEVVADTTGEAPETSQAVDSSPSTESGLGSESQSVTEVDESGAQSESVPTEGVVDSTETVDDENPGSPVPNDDSDGLPFR